MDSIQGILNVIDPVLIYPFRMFDNPMAGWWMGTFCLAAWAVLIGEVTMAVAGRINRSAVSTNLDDTMYYHEQSMKAKQAGDETAYKGINKLANEAYGKSFFLLMAMGMAALWPAFFAVAWLDKRFGDMSFIMPDWTGGLELNFVAPFILIYISLRLAWAKAKKKILPALKG
ncbi:MAG: hypothetical protein K9K40_00345 [Desulfotignum sp.]|nr:hypothetical protein [Desulfotignum sp.]MCF8126096.1 hypothetical protein [Desulfotignum sp.]